MRTILPFLIVLASAGLLVPALIAAPPGQPAARPAQMGSANYRLDWAVASEISGGASASANYHLNATIGQMAATTNSTSTNYGECSGFECVLELSQLYLPLIMR